MKAYPPISSSTDPIGRKPYLRKWLREGGRADKREVKNNFREFKRDYFYETALEWLENENLELAYDFRQTVEDAGRRAFLKEMPALTKSLKRCNNRSYYLLEQLLRRIQIESNLDFEFDRLDSYLYRLLPVSADKRKESLFEDEKKASVNKRHSVQLPRSTPVPSRPAASFLKSPPRINDKPKRSTPEKIYLNRETGVASVSRKNQQGGYDGNALMKRPEGERSPLANVRKKSDIARKIEGVSLAPNAGVINSSARLDKSRPVFDSSHPSFLRSKKRRVRESSVPASPILGRRLRQSGSEKECVPTDSAVSSKMGQAPVVRSKRLFSGFDFHSRQTLGKGPSDRPEIESPSLVVRRAPSEEKNMGLDISRMRDRSDSPSIPDDLIVSDNSIKRRLHRRVDGGGGLGKSKPLIKKVLESSGRGASPIGEESPPRSLIVSKDSIESRIARSREKISESGPHYLNRSPANRELNLNAKAGNKKRYLTVDSLTHRYRRESSANRSTKYLEAVALERDNKTISAISEEIQQWCEAQGIEDISSNQLALDKKIIILLDTLNVLKKLSDIRVEVEFGFSERMENERIARKLSGLEEFIESKLYKGAIGKKYGISRDAVDQLTSQERDVINTLIERWMRRNRAVFPENGLFLRKRSTATFDGKGYVEAWFAEKAAEKNGERIALRKWMEGQVTPPKLLYRWYRQAVKMKGPRDVGTINRMIRSRLSEKELPDNEVQNIFEKARKEGHLSPLLMSDLNAIIRRRGKMGSDSLKEASAAGEFYYSPSRLRDWTGGLDSPKIKVRTGSKTRSHTLDLKHYSRSRTFVESPRIKIRTSTKYKRQHMFPVKKILETWTEKS